MDGAALTSTDRPCASGIERQRDFLWGFAAGIWFRQLVHRVDGGGDAGISEKTLVATRGNIHAGGNCSGAIGLSKRGSFRRHLRRRLGGLRSAKKSSNRHENPRCRRYHRRVVPALLESFKQFAGKQRSVKGRILASGCIRES